MLAAAATALVLVAGFGIWVAPRTTALMAEVTRQRTALEQFQQAAGRVQRPVDTALAESMAEARRRARVLESAAKYLQTVRSEEAVRFSDYFAAFARRTLPGLWLTGFTANAPAGQVAL
ncbi:MAG: hypothetical protein JSW68_01120, partial [Burkholderiales bacterium]